MGLAHVLGQFCCGTMSPATMGRPFGGRPEDGKGFYRFASTSYTGVDSYQPYNTSSVRPPQQEHIGMGIVRSDAGKYLLSTSGNTARLLSIKATHMGDPACRMGVALQTVE